MPALTSAALDWLSAHHGVITLDVLRRFAVTDDQLEVLLRTGQLIPYVRAVYRLAGAPRTPSQLAALACASGSDVVVSHVSAARVWGLRRVGTDARLHVTIPGGRHRRLPDVAIHRTHQMHTVDLVEQDDGIRITSPPRTVFDLASIVCDEQLESIVEQVLNERLATMPTLLATARRLRERGRNGSARFGRVLEARPAWLKPVGSDLELVVERAIIAAGLPRPERQHDFVLPDGTRARVDFFWRVERVVLEVDHVTWHGGRLDLTADKRRDRLLRRIGITTIRITDADVRNHLPMLIDDLRAILGASRAR